MLCCRVLALWLITQAVQSLTALGFVIVDLVIGIFKATSQWGGLTGSTGIIAVMTVIQLFIAWLLWWKAAWIADRMVIGVHDTSAGASAVAADVLLTVAMAVLGMYLLAMSVPFLLRNIFLWVQENQTQPRVSPRYEIFPQLAQVVIGLWLFLGSRGIARSVKKMRWEPPAQTGGEDGRGA
jgi:hypothetical protein